MAEKPNPSVAIIGGGITGLTAAWRFQKAGVPYTLIEKSSRLGGKIQTDQMDGPSGLPFILERAGDAFLASQKPWATDLAYELGLDDEILQTNVIRPAVYILKGGTLIPNPDGLQLILPTNREAFLASPLMSDEGKARVLAEENVPPALDDADESIADFVRRRLGDEAVELLAEPLLSGIYSTHPEEQSLMATFPRYRQMVRQHGSLLGGLAKTQQARAAAQKNAPPADGPPRPTTPFISFKNGTEVLTQTLAQKLTGSLRTSTGVTQIEQTDAGQFTLYLDSGEQLQAEQVLITTPASVAGRLVQSIAPEASAELGKLRVVSTGVIFLAYRRAQINHPLNGFGVVIPRREKRNLNAMTWMSSKFPMRAPDDCVLLRLFFGGARTPHMMVKDDNEIRSIALAELQELMEIDAEPLFSQIYRWDDAQPQYDVGHLRRVVRIEKELPTGVYVAGCPYHGVGIPDCVRQGTEAAQRCLTVG